MKELVILRHAKSNRNYFVEDSNRPLSPEGIDRIKRVSLHKSSYFENTDMSKNCLILDEETIKLEGSTDGNICSGPCPKKGWKNMWYGMHKGLEKINIDDQILVSFRYDYF